MVLPRGRSVGGLTTRDFHFHSEIRGVLKIEKIREGSEIRWKGEIREIRPDFLSIRAIRPDR
jgi:hypothetical protein